MVTVYLSKRVTWDAPYFCLAYICMMSAGIETLIAVTAMRSRSVMSSSFFSRSDRAFKYIGKDVIAATPVTLMEPSVLSQSVRNAGGPAAMKSTEPESSASFITDGPPKLIQRTCRLAIPACLAYFSMS